MRVSSSTAGLSGISKSSRKLPEQQGSLGARKASSAQSTDLLAMSSLRVGVDIRSETLRILTEHVTSGLYWRSAISIAHQMAGSSLSQNNASGFTGA